MLFSTTATRAFSGDECGQPLRAAVGRKFERIINVGSVHTARDVALRRSESRTLFGVALHSAVEVARRGDKLRDTVIFQYFAAAAAR